VPPIVSPSSRPRAGTFAQICAIVFAGLASGALWCLLSLGLERGEGLLIAPLGLAVGFYFRWLGVYGMRGIVASSAAILIAFVYAQYLFAAVRVAQMLGLPLRSTLFQMDAALAWQVARANIGAWDVGALLAALVAAAILVVSAPRTGE